MTCRPGSPGRRTRSSSASSRTTRTPTARSRARPEKLDARDRALAQRIAYGTVQRVRALDHGIETLGRRPVRKLDPPVRAALRLGAYQLAYLDGVASHAAVNESVELVRAARLERAVPFTNAVMRRLDAGLRELLEALPEGPLKHSYPDWVHETWVRDWGEEEALALERAQNEAPETVVRLVRGDPPGEPTDVPGAYRVDRVDEQALAEGRIWPQSRGSQLAGLVVGEGRADPRPLRRPRAARRRCSALPRSSRSSCTRGAPASSRRTSAAWARRTSASSTPTRSRFRRS